MEMQSLTVKIVSEMLNRGIIQAKEKNIYCYGLEVLFLKVIAGFIALVLSILADTTGYLVGLCLFLIPIRKYAGGIHAKKRVTCLLYTEVILWLGQILWKYHLVPFVLLHVHVCLGMLVILWIAPAESEKRHLCAIKRLKYKRYAILCGSVTALCHCGAILLRCDYGMSITGTAMMIEMWLLVATKIEHIISDYITK